MQDSRLNYIEQHAERLGMDMGRLDAARDSAARSSPVGDTLDLCARYTDAATLEALVPLLVPLVRTIRMFTLHPAHTCTLFVLLLVGES